MADYSRHTPAAVLTKPEPNTGCDTKLPDAGATASMEPLDMFWGTEEMENRVAYLASATSPIDEIRGIVFMVGKGRVIDLVEIDQRGELQAPIPEISGVLATV